MDIDTIDKAQKQPKKERERQKYREAETQLYRGRRKNAANT